MTKMFKTTMLVAVFFSILCIIGCSGSTGGDGAICEENSEYCESPEPPVPEPEPVVPQTEIPESSFSGTLDVTAPKQNIQAGYADASGPLCYAQFKEEYGSDTDQYWIIIGVDYTDHISLFTEIEGLSDKGEFSADSLGWGLRKGGYPYSGKDVSGKLIVNDIFLQRPARDECIAFANIGYIDISIDILGTFELTGLYAKYANGGDATASGKITCVAPITYSNCVY